MDDMISTLDECDDSLILIWSIFTHAASAGRHSQAYSAYEAVDRLLDNRLVLMKAVSHECVS